MEKKKYVVFFDRKVKVEYNGLKNNRWNELQLFSYLEKATDNLKTNPYCGQQIPKRQMPRYYEWRFGELKNLWKYDLPDGWRLIYTVIDDEVQILSILLEWMDHKNYERRFGYSQK